MHVPSRCIFHQNLSITRHTSVWLKLVEAFTYLLSRFINLIVIRFMLGRNFSNYLYILCWIELSYTVFKKYMRCLAFHGIPYTLSLPRHVWGFSLRRVVMTMFLCYMSKILFIGCYFMVFVRYKSWEACEFELHLECDFSIYSFYYVPSRGTMLNFYWVYGIF